MISRLKHILFYFSSPLIRVNLIFSFILIIFSFFMFVFSNPFTNYDSTESINDICIDVNKDDIFYNHSGYSHIPYMYKNEDFFILKNNEYSKLDSIVVEHADYRGQGKELVININDIKNCINPHPLPFMYNYEGNIFLLGTTPEGYDFNGKLFSSFFKTLQLSLYSLFSFILTGLSLGIFLGYYKNDYKKTFIIINYFQKIIESVPIILWMIISYAFLSIHLPDSLSAYKIQIAFLLFGIFSSTALSKILVSKFNTFRKEDFIVALKLLGISDFRIIFVHIIQYYCLPLIIMQTIYIFAQCFFMDITLTVLNYGDKNTLGALFLEFLSVINKDSTFHFVVILSLFIYVILSSFFIYLNI